METRLNPAGASTNVRTWAGHRQAFPLGQSHTPLTSTPTLGRALTDGNLNEVGFVNSFLQHLAQQPGSIEKDSDGEDFKYEDEDEEDEDDSREDEEDYCSRNKKRRTRWRANYPKIKKTRGSERSSSSACHLSRQRRASVAVPSENDYNASGLGSGRTLKKKGHQRSHSVSSYFALCGLSESNMMSLPPQSRLSDWDYPHQHHHLPQQHQHCLQRTTFPMPAHQLLLAGSNLDGHSCPHTAIVGSNDAPSRHVHHTAQTFHSSSSSSSSPVRESFYSPSGAPLATDPHACPLRQPTWGVADAASSTLETEAELEGIDPSSSTSVAGAASATHPFVPLGSECLANEGYWLEELLLEQPSSGAASSFPSTPLSPNSSSSSSSHAGPQPTPNKDAIYAELASMQLFSYSKAQLL